MTSYSNGSNSGWIYPRIKASSITTFQSQRRKTILLIIIIIIINNKSDDTIICLSSDDEDDVEIIDPLIRAALGNVKIDIRTQQSELERLTCSKVEKKRIKQEKKWRRKKRTYHH